MRVIFLICLEVAMFVTLPAKNPITGGKKVSEKFNQFDMYKDSLYKVRPLEVLIGHNGKLSLLSQDMVINDPKRTRISIKKKQRIVLHCTGLSNHLALKEEEKLDIFKDKLPTIWKSSQRLALGQYPQDQIDESRCLSPMLATISIDEEREICATGKGILLRVGFIVDNSSFPLYRICFDKETMLPLYASHVLVASECLFPENILIGIPMVRATKRAMAVKNPRAPFRRTNQEKIFRSIFGYLYANNYFKFKDSEGLILTAATLVSPGDFYFDPMKTATLILENTLPMFTCIYQGNRLIIEIIGRMLALKAKEKSLEVTSGSFGMLELEDAIGIPHYIYLDSEEDGKKKYRPVPKYFYKIYYDPIAKKAISFVTLNNPFFEVSDEDFPCENIQTRFIDIDFLQKIPSAGYTIYCDVKDLMKIVKDIPNMDLSGGILTFDIYKSDVNLYVLRGTGDNVLLKLKKKKSSIVFEDQKSVIV